MAPATLGLRASAGSLSLPAASADGWISLLNGHDLTGWYSMLEKSGKDVAQSRKIVMMEQDMLHILGNEVTDEPMETTHEEFENVHIRVEYKWGVKRFPPRAHLLGKPPHTRQDDQMNCLIILV
jgi:hypothetical protein